MDWLKTYLKLSKGEFRGMVGLWVVILIGIGSSFLFRIYRDNARFDYKEFEKEIVEFSRSLREESARRSRSSYTKRAFLPKATYFSFDPNTLDSLSWIRLGLPAYVARAILNYVRKGGHFYKKEDLRRIYSLKPEIYEKLEPYITLRSPERRSEVPRFPERPVLAIDLNQADSAKLELLPGIGPAFAIRILKYRERLGGFYRREQLLEVFGLDSAKYLALKDRVHASPEAIKQVNLNSASFEDLRKHPYLTYKQINVILQYRKQHGNFTSIEDLLKTGVMSSEQLLRIRPYLALQTN